MAEILVRDLPDEVLAAIDAHARRAGLSRTEYIRRALSREGSAGDPAVRLEDPRFRPHVRRSG